MEQSKSPEIKEQQPKDISAEFLSMRTSEFLDLVYSLRKEPSLTITIDWRDAITAIRLKAFLEGGSGGQKRSATIRATENQHKESVNVFHSGVKWEKVND